MRPAIGRKRSFSASEILLLSVMMACSNARSQPQLHGSRFDENNDTIVLTNDFAVAAFVVYVLIISDTSTFSWSECQQSKSVTMAMGA